jgi:hypothetical protein
MDQPQVFRRVGVALALVLGLAMAIWAAARAVPESAPARPGTLKLAELEARYGITIEALRPTAAGHMLDLRYRVLDSDKAGELLTRGVKPRLIHEERGLTLGTPSFAKVGALRQTGAAPEAGRVYFVLFSNPGQRVAPGDAVSLAIGDRRVDRIEVQGRAQR